MTEAGKDGNAGKREGSGLVENRQSVAAWASSARCPGPFVLLVLPVRPAFRAKGSLSNASTLASTRPPFNRQLWGVALVDESGRLLYGRNEDRLFIPASNTKLVVSAVASALLPPDWRVKTSLYGGPVVGGVLQGDLVLYGRGDPTMDRRCYGLDTTPLRRVRHGPVRPAPPTGRFAAGQGGAADHR